MATIKNTSNVLGNLVNQVNAAAGSSGPISSYPTAGSFAASMPGSGGIVIDDDSIPAGMLNPEPVFEINYKSTQKQCIKKAKEQLIIIVKEVVPDFLQDSTMIKDKILQDAESLGNLYYEYAKSDKVVQACMETIARGETQARLFEVYAKLSKQLQELTENITETQNKMRKYYIDTYLDLQQKDQVDENMLGISKSDSPKSIEGPVQEEPQQKMESSNIISGTDNTIKMIQERKKLAMIAKYQEVKE